MGSVAFPSGYKVKVPVTCLLALEGGQMGCECATMVCRSSDFTWYSLTDQVDWDIALREANGRVNALGFYDLC